MTYTTEIVESDGVSIELQVNGRARRAHAGPTDTLVEVLRDRLGLTGTKVGCEEGRCGACTVILDGDAVSSCLVLAVRCDGATVRTIEGLAPSSSDLHPLQESFVEHGGIQCGFCTPGMIMTAVAALASQPQLTEADIRQRLVGNYCRCTGYTKIVDSIVAMTATGDLA